jgi:hypothetical protein
VIRSIEDRKWIELKKNKKSKNLVWFRWPGWPARPNCNPLIFIFLTKTTLFWFKNFLTWPIRWPGQNPKPGSWIGSDIKTMLKRVKYFLKLIFKAPLQEFRELLSLWYWSSNSNCWLFWEPNLLVMLLCLS